MPKYTKRPDGRYHTSVTIGRNESGKRIVKEFYGRSIKELDAKLSDFKSMQNKGIIISDNKITLSEWADKWLKAYKQGVSHNTNEMYRLCIEKHIRPADISSLPLVKIKTVDLQSLVNKLLDDGKNRTAEILILTLRQIFEQALDNDMLYKNPAKALKKPTFRAAPKRSLTEIENKAIKKAKLSDRERAFLYIGKYAGLRRGEILALTKGDIDTKKKTLTVNKAVVFNGNDGEVKPMPKSKAGFREIPMPDILNDFLKTYLSSLDGLCLFTTAKGDICTKSSVRKMWDSIIEKLNVAAGAKGDIRPITGLTPHILRHDYATSLYYAGVDVKTAQKLLGHSDIKMTLQIYTHLDQDNAAISDKLNKIFDGQKVVSAEKSK